MGPLQAIHSDAPKGYVFELSFIGGGHRHVVTTAPSRIRARSQILQSLMASGEIFKLATMQETQRITNVTTLKRREVVTCAA